LADVARRYSNLAIPPLLRPNAVPEPAPTLEDQAHGRDVLQPSTDVPKPRGGSRRLTIDKIEQIIQLYRAGRSVQAIQREVHVRRSTVARILAEAGLRPI
jgi:hypothetical protein